MSCSHGITGAPPLYTELSLARSLNVDNGLSLSRVKVEPRDSGYGNGGLSLSAGVKPPPTIPESHEPPSVCSGALNSSGGLQLSLLSGLTSLTPMTPVVPQVSSSSNSLSLGLQQQQIKLEPNSNCSLTTLEGSNLQLRPSAATTTGDCADLNLDTLDTLQDTLQGGLECDVDQVSTSDT